MKSQISRYIIPIIIFFLMPILCYAKHVEFMGIPLDETISTFTSHLQKKRFSVNRESSSMEIGTRLFDGSFYGEKCMLFVYYNPKTKIVYRTKVCVSFSSKHNADMYIEDLRNGLDIKYGAGYYDEFEANGFPGYRKTLVDKAQTSVCEDHIGYLVIGEIQIFMSYYPQYDDYTVYVDYYDTTNYSKSQNDKINDL